MAISWGPPEGTSPPCFSFTRFILEQCLLKKTSIWPLLTVWKLPGHHIVLNTADTRHTVMPWRIPFSPELFHIGIVCLLLWQIPSPQRSLGYSLFKQKFSQKILCFLGCCFLCVVFVFYFIKISKFALPCVMLMYAYSYIPEGTFLPRKEGSFRGRKIFVRKEAFK